MIFSISNPAINLKLFISIFLILLSVIILTPLAHVHAQKNDLRFMHLTSDDGLPQNKVNCILQDSQGFMWFGTNDGLSKYDGYVFTNFDYDSADVYKPSDDFVQAMLEDNKGNLWFCTGSGGLNLYNRVSTQFKHFRAYSSMNNRISNDNVQAIVEDSNNFIWIGTSTGIDKIDIETHTVVNYIPSHFNDIRSNKSSIMTLCVDKQNNFWFGTNGDGLGLFDPKHETYKYFRHNANDIHSISDDNILSIYEDYKGNLWIGTYNGGFNLYDRERKQFIRYYPDQNIRESLTVRAILDDKEGNLWIGTRNGLYIFNKKTHQFNNYVHDPHNPFSLSQNNIQSIFRDAKGDFWVGTKQGVNFLNTTNMAFVHYRADAYNPRCLNHNLVTAFLEDSHGELWFGTTEGGLNRLNRETGIFTYYTHDLNNPNSISSNNVNTIAEDGNGNLWIGTFQGGLNMYHRREDRFIYYKLDPDVPLIYQQAIASLIIDEANDLWIGTSENGLKRFNIQNHEFINYSLNKSGSEPTIRCLYQDDEGKIWIGSDNSKLYCFDKKSLESNSYLLPVKSTRTTINAFHEDRHSNLWIGTGGRGLYCFNKHDKSFQAYTKENGLPNINIQGILEDEHGNLWISTENGLSKFNPVKQTFKNYYKENGLQSNQFTNSFYKTRSGEMFFGGMNGATSFYPDQIRESSYMAPLYITDFKIFNKSVSLGSDQSILKVPIEQTKYIPLSYKHSSFTFTFALLNYGTSERNLYAYKMDGFETDWNYAGTRRFATYTNLNPGSYTFRVKEISNDGLWNEKGASIKISISPPFWKTWWFKFIVVAIVVLACWHFVNHQGRKRDLLKATSLANLTQLKLLRNQMNPHFLLNVLSAIRGLVLVDKDQAWKMMSKLTEFLRYVLLNYNKIEDTLSKEIDAAKNYISIQKVCFHENLQVSYDVDDAARDCVVPAFIFQPLIENAIKYSQQTSPKQLNVKLLISYNQGILSIDVSNTGKLIHRVTEDGEENKAHGTSIKNIKKRLGIMFNDQFTFDLFEEAGWVHAKMTINYEKVNLEKSFDAVEE